MIRSSGVSCAGDPRADYERKLMQVLLGVVIGAGLFAAGAVTHRVYLEAVGVVIVLPCPAVCHRVPL